MVQLKILSGKKAGTETVARHFPFQVGRGAQSGLVLDDPGVWENHFTIDLEPAAGFLLSCDPKTSVMIDGKTFEKTPLRSGDVIELGLAKIQFGLSATRQKSLTLREWLTWIALAVLCVGQIVLIYQLIR